MYIYIYQYIYIHMCIYIIYIYYTHISIDVLHTMLLWSCYKSKEQLEGTLPSPSSWMHFNCQRQLGRYKGEIQRR